MTDVPPATRDHAEELRKMHCTLLAGGADWSDVLLDAAVTMEQWQAVLQAIATGRDSEGLKVDCYQDLAREALGL
jgi:hypothetical protein